MQRTRDTLVPIIHHIRLVPTYDFRSLLAQQHMQHRHELLGEGPVALEGHRHKINVAGSGSLLVFRALKCVRSLDGCSRFFDGRMNDGLRCLVLDGDVQQQI